MRIAILSLSLLLCMTANAHAQTAQVDRIDVVDYGIYTAQTESRQAAPGTATGTTSTVTNLQHAATTLTIPAQIGVRFGFRYIVIGTSAGTVVQLHMVNILPSPGLRNPATQQLQAQEGFDTNVPIGRTWYRGYTLDHDWEVVPGTWTFQVWYQGRKLAEQTFTLVKQ